jgi:hypothetical protein
MEGTLKKSLLLSAALLALAPSGAWAQSGCLGVGNVNNVPQVGVTCQQEPTGPSYAATAVGLVAAATPTDIACITGSATRVIRLQSIRISGTISTQLMVPALLMKRATVDTGGTPATGTALPVPYALDSTNPAATATTTAWTANPTITDSSPGIIDSGVLSLAKTDGTNGSGQPFTLWDYTERNYVQAPLLRGIAQQLCVNLNANAGTFTGNAISITFKWTELQQ